MNFQSLFNLNISELLIFDLWNDQNTLGQIWLNQTKDWLGSVVNPTEPHSHSTLSFSFSLSSSSVAVAVAAWIRRAPAGSAAVP